MNRDRLLKEVSARLGSRRLVWSGLRGEDVEPLADLPQADAAYSMIGPYGRRSGIEGHTYEDLTGVRPDLEVYDIDRHLAEADAQLFRRAHLRSLSEPSALIPYRASQFLSSIWFARRDRCLLLGMFGGHQAAFEHKPWVETSLQGLGLATVPWTYVADEEQLTTRDLLADGPIVLRRSRTSGGEGFTLVHDEEHLLSEWPKVSEAFVSVAPFLEDTLPLNVGATVWTDGVTVHHPSVQLVGIPSCVSRPFGYCGNDFTRVSALEPSIIDEIEATTRTIGRWLQGHGYIGTFGVDYLLSEGKLLFTEINPRFQGSTHASCRLSIEANESCLMLEHVAAHLGLAAPPARPLRERIAETRPLAHLVVHWTGPDPAQIDPTPLLSSLASISVSVRSDVRTRRELTTMPGAVVGRVTVQDRVTDNGFELLQPWADAVSQWRQGAQQDEADHERNPSG